MAEITVEESWREIRTLTDRADRADRAERAMADGWPGEAVDRWRAVLDHRARTIRSPAADGAS